MKILLCLIVFALCACRANSYPAATTIVPCVHVKELSHSFSALNISSASMETLRVQTPNDACCSGLRCLKLYHDELDNLSNKKPHLNDHLKHLVRKLKFMDLKEDECETEGRNLKTFFERFNKCLSTLGRTCKEV